MPARAILYLKWEGYYDYSEQNVKKYVLAEPPLPGVYKIASLHKYGRLVPFYIGKTSNLYEALLLHLSKKERNLCLKRELQEQTCCFKFARVFDELTRQRVFKALYLHYHPHCNKAKDVPRVEPVSLKFH